MRQSEISQSKMRNKWIVVGALVLLSFAAAAQDEDLSKVEMKVIKVSGSVYMLQGSGGNIGASVGEDGIVIVDDEFAPLADKIRAALKGVTDKPVRFVINTHWHFDHTGGNEAFSPTSTVIAQDDVRKRLITGGTAGYGVGDTNVKPASKAALPIITFDHDVSVHVNGGDIRALHFPHGHTDGDSVIFFPQSNVVHMGDDFVTYGFPFVDLRSGGSVAGMIAAMEQVSAQLPADVKVIPGHGPISTLDDVRRYTTMLKETRAVVEKGVKAGKTLDQLKQENVLAPWQKWSGEFITTEQWLITLYNDLTGKPSEFIKHN